MPVIELIQNSFDEIDYLIILELQKDARMSFAKVAKAININERTALRRINALVKSGAIRFSTICEPSAFRYNNTFDVNIYVQEEFRQHAIDLILSNSMVCYLSTGIDDGDITVQARFKSAEEISEFLNVFIKKIDGVEVKSYYFEAKILRDIDTWQPSEHDFLKQNRINRTKKTKK